MSSGEYILLPIYDAQGLDTGKAVQIALHRIKSAFGMHAKIVDNVNVAEEIEVLDRIVHGLAPRVSMKRVVLQEGGMGRVELAHALMRTDKTNPWREYNQQNGVGEFAKNEEPVDLNEELSSYPNDEWREIPGFSSYEMHGIVRLIRVKSTHEEPKVFEGRLDNVILTNNDGIVKRMSVDHLFNQTFPELNK